MPRAKLRPDPELGHAGGFVDGSGIRACVECGYLAEFRCGHVGEAGERCNRPLCDRHSIEIKTSLPLEFDGADRSDGPIRLCPDHRRKPK